MFWHLAGAALRGKGVGEAPEARGRRARSGAALGGRKTGHESCGMADDDGVKTCNPSRRTSLAVPCEWCPAPARQTWSEQDEGPDGSFRHRSRRPASLPSVSVGKDEESGWEGRKSAEDEVWRGCWLGAPGLLLAGSQPGAFRRRPDPPDRRTAKRRRRLPT